MSSQPATVLRTTKTSYREVTSPSNNWEQRNSDPATNYFLRFVMSNELIMKKMSGISSVSPHLASLWVCSVTNLRKVI